MLRNLINFRLDPITLARQSPLHIYNIIKDLLTASLAVLLILKFKDYNGKDLECIYIIIIPQFIRIYRME